MLLIGAPGSEFRRAAELAQSAGAEVTMADAPAPALEALREQGADLVMIDVLEDVVGFLDDLRRERFVVPVLACGISAPAERAVAAIRAGARDYVPLPPQRELIAAAIASVVERQAQVRIGGHPVLDRAMALAAAVAPSGAPVLVSGG
jgi:DNA-binding NtrC family response regulator